MTWRGVIVALAVVILTAACGTAAADGPPDIKYGRDICVQCNMIISEIGHAAAYRLADGTEKAFDGIGEMVVHGRNSNELEGAEAWVHDFRTEEWVRAEDAFYVPTLAVSSPMGHGIFGFAERALATQFAIEVGGEVIDWSTVLQLPVVDGLVGDIHGHDRVTDSGEGTEPEDMGEMEGDE